MCGIKGSTRLTQEHVKAEAVHKQGVSIDKIPNPHLLRTVVGSPCCKVQPDRVTLQPITATLCRRTPFDHYKNKSAYKDSEVRTSKHLVFRLGISILDLQETLAQEIDDLLKEIEFTRTGAEVFTKDGEERSTTFCNSTKHSNSQKRVGRLLLSQSALLLHSDRVRSVVLKLSVVLFLESKEVGRRLNLQFKVDATFLLLPHVFVLWT